MSRQAKELLWFNISVLHASIAAFFLANASYPPVRAFCAFSIVHGSLWAIFRALSCIHEHHTAKEGERGDG